MYVCIYVCMCVFIQVYVLVFVYAYIRICTQTYLHNRYTGIPSVAYQNYVIYVQSCVYTRMCVDDLSHKQIGLWVDG